MNVTLLQKYIQITVEEESDFLHKALAYAEKYFSKSYRLSSTILILDDGERFKKDYLVNWANHFAKNLENDAIFDVFHLAQKRDIDRKSVV